MCVPRWKGYSNDRHNCTKVNYGMYGFPRLPVYRIENGINGQHNCTKARQGLYSVPRLPLYHILRSINVPRWNDTPTVNIAARKLITVYSFPRLPIYRLYSRFGQILFPSKPVVRSIEVSHTAFKYEFRHNPLSQLSFSKFSNTFRVEMMPRR